jgi:hypothetical protein
MMVALLAARAEEIAGMAEFREVVALLDFAPAKAKPSIALEVLLQACEGGMRRLGGARGHTADAIVASAQTSETPPRRYVIPPWLGRLITATLSEQMRIFPHPIDPSRYLAAALQ